MTIYLSICQYLLDLTEYMPAARQFSPREVLSHNLVALRFSTAEWRSILENDSCELGQRRAKHKDMVMKKPSGTLPGVRKRPASHLLKRHTFNKKRVRVL